MTLFFIVGKKFHISLIALTTVAIFMACMMPLEADTPPIIPVGLDAYLMWDHWCDQRIGQRTYMAATTDPAAQNNDPGNFRFQINDPNYTTDVLSIPMDLQGPGVVVFMRYNYDHGSPWHFMIDGADNVVGDSNSPGLSNPNGYTAFIPPGTFPSGNPSQPITTTGTNPNMPFNILQNISQDADLIYTPLHFTNSFRLGYEQTNYGTGYYIYNKYMTGAQLSIGGAISTNNITSPTTWTASTPASAQMLNVINLIGKAGTNLAAGLPGLSTQSGGTTLSGTNTVNIATLSGASVIRRLNFSVPTTDAVNFSTVNLVVTWDGRTSPSINAPISLFFGSGTLYTSSTPSDGKYMVRGFPMNIQFVGTGSSQRAQLSCYFPMPFFQSAQIQLVGNGNTFNDIQWSISTVPFTDSANHVGYFHATYKDQGTGVSGQDNVLLDTNTVEGGTGSWTGSVVGTSVIFSTSGDVNTLEGNPLFFLDDSGDPQGQGTGTEEWGGGGNFWNFSNITTLPFEGHPVGSYMGTGQAGIQSTYRFLLADLLPFGKHAIFKLQHGATDTSTQHYMTLAYWYGLPVASLIKTDSLQLGNSTSESAHSYSASGSTSYTVPSTQYDGSVNPPAATTDTGRVIPPGNTSQFIVAIDPNNIGVMLRRKLDYAYPNQTATVSIAPVPPGGGPPEAGAWQTVGTWYTAGANTWVYSLASTNPGLSQQTVKSVNRCFRDTEFLLPKTLTAGLSSIYVQITNTTPNIPLVAASSTRNPPLSAIAFPLPSSPRPQVSQAWTELHYDAYSMVMPSYTIGTALTFTNGPTPTNGVIGTPYNNFTYTATGTPSPTFSVTSGNLPPGLILSSAGTISGTPTAVGTYSGTVTASNGINPSATQSFNITVLNSYNNWANFYFPGQPPNISDPSAMPLGDGATNLLKYFCNIVPTVIMNASDRLALPMVGQTVDGQYLTLTYRQSSSAGGVSAIVQTSFDLKTWQVVSNQNVIQIGTDSSTGDPIMQAKIPINGSRQFVRLNVSKP